VVGVWDKLRCSLVAQIRGGFINGSGLFAKVVGVVGMSCDAPVAQIRGGFINRSGLFAKVGVGEKLRCAPVHFRKIRAYIRMILLSCFL
jgi:hypothetical protein